MRKLLGLVLVCALISPCAALFNKDDAGTTAGQFLKLGMGGKAAAMGDAVVAGVDDSTSIVWNPAGLTGVKGTHLALMHSLYVADIFYDYLTFAKEFQGLGTFGVGVQYVNYGSIIEMDNLATELSAFTPYDLAFNLGYAITFSEINAGVNIKYVSSSIKNTANAVAVDAGLQYTLEGVKLGLAGYNFGTGMKFVNDTVSLPSYIRIGATCSPISNLQVEVDGEFPTDNAIGFAVGAQYEYSLEKNMSLLPRIGYNSVSEVTGFKGFTFGFGFNWESYTLDYALVTFGDMGMKHCFSVSLGDSKHAAVPAKETHEYANETLTNVKTAKKISDDAKEALKQAELAKQTSVAANEALKQAELAKQTSVAANEALKQAELAKEAMKQAELTKETQRQELAKKNAELIEQAKTAIKEAEQMGAGELLKSANDNLEKAVRSNSEKDFNKSIDFASKALDDAGAVKSACEAKAATSAEYKVKEGDNLWDLSKKIYNDALLWPLIYNANKDHINADLLIHPNQELKLPRAIVDYKVKDGDNLWDIAKKIYNDALLWPLIYNANKEQINTDLLIRPDHSIKLPCAVTEGEKAAAKEESKMFKFKK